MRSSKQALDARLNAWHEENRQWKRMHNIGYALLRLKFAHAKKDEEESVFFAALLHSYDYVGEEYKSYERERRLAKYSRV